MDCRPISPNNNLRMEIARGIGNFLLQVGQGVPVHKITLSSILHGSHLSIQSLPHLSHIIPNHTHMHTRQALLQH